MKKAFLNKCNILFILVLVAGCNYTPNISMVEAVNAGDEKAVRYYLKQGESVDQKDEKGWPLIALAAIQGSVPILKHLIEAGADVNARSKRGTTTLMLASGGGHVETVKELLAAGADMNAKDEGGCSALVYAGSAEVVKELLAAGADVNAKCGNDSNGRTALIYASWRGDADVVKELLVSGADVNAKDDSKESALMYARSAEVAKELLAAGADVNAKDESKNTALILASRNGHAEVVKALLLAGADVNAKNWNNTTALSQAFSLKREDVKKELLEHITKLLLPIIDKYYVKNGLFISGTIDEQIYAFYQGICESVKGNPVMKKMCSFEIPETWDITPFYGGRLMVSKSVKHWIVGDVFTLDMKQETKEYSFIVDLKEKTIGAENSDSCLMLIGNSVTALLLKQQKGLSVDFPEECKVSYGKRLQKS